MESADPQAPPVPSALDRVVDDQCLAVLAAIDDLRQDLPGTVHDARVALRKLRSTLVVFRPLLDKEASRHLEEELRWFAGELGVARDVQVVRERVRDALEPGPEADQVLAELDALADGSWERAEAALSDPRLAALTATLEQTRLRSLGASRSPGRAWERLGARIAELLDRAESAVPGSRTEPADDETLHALRKRVKRVRFATGSLREHARDALPGGAKVGRVAKSLEELQDLLGEYQDAVVTAGFLERVGSRAPALAELVGELAQGQRRAAARVREALPSGVERVRAAAARLPVRQASARTPDVHLPPP